MSVCISRKGEFGSHDIDDEYTCRDCGVLDETALMAELRALRLHVVPTLDEVRERTVPLGGGLALAWADFGGDEAYSDGHTIVRDLDRANLVTSTVVKSDGTLTDWHKVVIDVDMPCELIPSSTPGHFHLLIDKAMPWQTYCALLGALVSAGIVESGYLSAALERGHTAVRLPWVRKAARLPWVRKAAQCPHAFEDHELLPGDTHEQCRACGHTWPIPGETISQ